MRPITTFDELKRWSTGITEKRGNFLAKAMRSKEHYQLESSFDTFLSHSSKDAEYLPAVIQLLENHGARVYCDLTDERMPKKPSHETGTILKAQITQGERLVVFTTKNSKDSKWVPWELGIADVALNTPNVALFAAAEHGYDNEWTTQEYLGIYRKIIFAPLEGYAEPLWIVYDEHENVGEPLRTWCKSYSRSRYGRY